jgi:hypothetical protein
MSLSSKDNSYIICSSCKPQFEDLIDDLSKHISKEISLLRVNSVPLLDEGISPTKLQPFPRTLGKFLKKLLDDLKQKQYKLIESYCEDLFTFTETINYKTRGQG